MHMNVQSLNHAIAYTPLAWNGAKQIFAWKVERFAQNITQNKMKWFGGVVASFRVCTFIFTDIIYLIHSWKYEVKQFVMWYLTIYLLDTPIYQNVKCTCIFMIAHRFWLLGLVTRLTGRGRRHESPGLWRGDRHARFVRASPNGSLWQQTCLAWEPKLQLNNMPRLEFYPMCFIFNFSDSLFFHTKLKW